MPHNLTEKIQQQENKESSHIRIPGVQDPSKAGPVKRINVIESDKYIPNSEIKNITAENGVDQVQFIFSVPEENSAKDFTIDVSEDEVKLESKK